MSLHNKRKGILFAINLIALLFIFHFFSHAQNRKEAILLMPDGREKMDSILSYADSVRSDLSKDALYREAFQLLKQTKYYEIEPALFNSYGVYKRDLSEYAESIGFHLKALDLAQHFDNIHEEIKACNNLGVVYRRVDDYMAALEYLNKSRALSEKAGDDYSLSIAYNSIGNIHSAREDYRAAIHYFLICLPIAAKADNKRGTAINLQNIGECYEKLGKLDSAKLYYNNALKYNAGRNDIRGIAICYNSLGNIAIREGRVYEGLNLMQKALQHNRTLKDKYYVAVSYNSIGNAYMQLNEFATARRMFDTSLNLATLIGSVSETKNAYQGLMKAAAAQQDWLNAYKYGSKFKILSDSILVHNNQSLRAKEFAYHQEKLALREKDDKNKNIIMVGSLILFLLLLVSGILYYLRNRLLERNRSLQRELEIRSQIASDLHDDMGSSLSSIHIFSELLRKSGSNSHDLLSKIEANAKDTLEALDDIIWLVKPSNDKFSNLSMHISEFSIPLFESKNIAFEIDFPDAISEIPLPMETRRNIFLIIKESVNNLIKYSECTKASIKASYEQGDLCFIIKDNGKGFDTSKLTNRNGLKNLKARASQINATIQIKSAPGQGTEIILVVRARELAVLHAV